MNVRIMYLYKRYIVNNNLNGRKQMKNKGITLITLVITIILLIILAGILLIQDQEKMEYLTKQNMQRKKQISKQQQRK